MTSAINSVSLNGLTQQDISRMPQNSVNYAAVANGVQDSFEATTQKSSTMKKVLIGTAIAAGAIVGLKHLGFMKPATGEVTGIFAKAWNYTKTGVNKLGGWIETPFIASYNYLKGLFTKPKPTEFIKN